MTEVVQTTLETLPRAKESNPLNLTDLEFAQMKKEVKELSEKYPQLPIGMLRQAWMYHYLKYVSIDTEYKNLN